MELVAAAVDPPFDELELLEVFVPPAESVRVVALVPPLELDAIDDVPARALVPPTEIALEPPAEFTPPIGLAPPVGWAPPSVLLLTTERVPALVCVLDISLAPPKARAPPVGLAPPDEPVRVVALAPPVAEPKDVVSKALRPPVVPNFEVP